MPKNHINKVADLINNQHMTNQHTFHIPVMGIGFTVDTPLKVSQYGIDSVVSIVDDMLLEKLRKMYCETFEIPYKEISEKIEDFRAKRITSYLNLLHNLAEKKMDEMKSATIDRGNEIKEYFGMLPDSSSLKQEFKKLTSKYFNLSEMRGWLKENLSMGSIDVNIMTKLDKVNYSKGEQLPAEFNDAHAALRGYANSDLSSSIVLSAGMNPRLYSYMERFDDFYPDTNGWIKKKIVLKVSDYRSALIQGKFLAKKGLWVSEYRIESGLNCGGHAFATDGFLMGPILDEFKTQRQDLLRSVSEICNKALTDKKRHVPQQHLPLKITAQGGVGTAEEHQFLIDHYDIDSVGWGTPFLLVPEVTSIDEPTLKQLVTAKEADLYLSNISPLGVPFNSLRDNTKDDEKMQLVDKGTPGSVCPKRYLASNKELTSKAVCTASRQYQRLKIQELDLENLPKATYQKKFDKIIEKSCLCVGLGTSALLVNNLDTTTEGEGVSVCPGPNMAYFSKKKSLKEMIDHIYSRSDNESHADRPNMFVKELALYIDYLRDRIDETKTTMTKKQEKYLTNFSANLKTGIDYYQNLFSGLKNNFVEAKSNILHELESSHKELQKLNSKKKELIG